MSEKYISWLEGCEVKDAQARRTLSLLERRIGLETAEETGDKCFCHFNGYAVKDAQAHKRLTDIENTIEEYLESTTEKVITENGTYSPSDDGVFAYSKITVCVPDNPHPIEINSHEEMDEIIANATSDSLGAIYKYVGGATAKYKKDGLYLIVVKNYGYAFTRIQEPPKVATPLVSISGDTLTISDSTHIAEQFTLFVNDNPFALLEVGESGVVEYNLAHLTNSTEEISTYSIYVIASAMDYNDSLPSVTLTYTDTITGTWLMNQVLDLDYFNVQYGSYYKQTHSLNFKQTRSNREYSFSAFTLESNANTGGINIFMRGVSSDTSNETPLYYLYDNGDTSWIGNDQISEETLRTWYITFADENVFRWIKANGIKL